MINNEGLAQYLLNDCQKWNSFPAFHCVAKNFPLLLVE